MWRNELLIPAYLSAFSILLLLLHALLSSKLVRRPVASKQPSEAIDEEEEEAITEPAASPHAGIINDIKTHVHSMGGPVIFTYKVLRLLGCLVLVVLTIVTLVIDEEQRTGTLGFGVAKKKHKGSRKGKGGAGFTKAEWLQIALGLTYVSINYRIAVYTDRSTRHPRRMLHYLLLSRCPCGVHGLKQQIHTSSCCF